MPFPWGKSCWTHYNQLQSYQAHTFSRLVSPTLKLKSLHISINIHLHLTRLTMRGVQYKLFDFQSCLEALWLPNFSSQASLSAWKKFNFQKTSDWQDVCMTNINYFRDVWVSLSHLVDVSFKIISLMKFKSFWWCSWKFLVAPYCETPYFHLIYASPRLPSLKYAFQNNLFSPFLHFLFKFKVNTRSLTTLE